MDAMPMGYWPDPDHRASWSVNDHLIANLTDTVNHLTWVVASIFSKKVKEPDPVYRPGSDQPAAQQQRRKPPAKKVPWMGLDKAIGAMRGRRG